jgi:hypothetical protein
MSKTDCYSSLQAAPLKCYNLGIYTAHHRVLKAHEMKRKMSEKTPDEGIGLRDWLGHSLPSGFPCWIEVYIALQPSYTPPSFIGIHCLYMLTQEQVDFNTINQYLHNKHPLQIVVSSAQDAVQIVQHICPSFNTKNLNFHCE